MTKGRTYIVAVLDEHGNRFEESLTFATTARGAVQALKRQSARYRDLAKQGARFEAHPYPHREAGFIDTYMVAVVTLFLVMLACLVVAGLLILQAAS